MQVQQRIMSLVIREREKQRQRQRDRDRETDRQRQTDIVFIVNQAKCLCASCTKVKHTA